MSKLSTRRTLSIILMLAIVLSTIPLLTPINAQNSETVELEGVVQDESNFKVSHAKVYYVNTCTGARDELTTGADGYFSFNVKEGTYAIYASATGYISAGQLSKKYVSIDLDDTPAPVILTLRKVPRSESEKVMVNGTVINAATSIGIDGATIQFRSISGNYSGYTDATESETWEVFINGSTKNITGKYEIELFDGDFHVVVTHESYRTFEMNVSINGDTELANFTLLKRMDEKTDLISGYMKNSETGQIIPGTAYLYDWESRLFLSSSTEGRFFQIPAYTPGKFMLIVDADGYNPAYINDVELPNPDPNQGDYWSYDVLLKPIAMDEETKKPIRTETITTTVDFGSDWNTTAVHTDWLMDADSMIYGLEQEGRGGLRYQIDFERVLWSGNRDRAVDLDEVNEFEKFLKNRGPCRVSTRDFIKVNGSYFTQTSYSVDTENVAANDYTAAYKPITVKSDTNYKITEGESGNSFKVDIGTIRTNEKVILKIPKNYEISKWMPEDADFVLTSFYQAEIGSSDVTITVNRLDGPKAEMTVTGTYITPKTDLTFNGSKSKDDAGRGIQNYTWDMDDGTILYGEEVVYNYTAAGEFNVTLTVKDSSDLTDITWKIIQVDSSEPNPTFIIENKTHVEYPKDSQGRYMIDEDKTVFFNATKSTDTLNGVIKVDLDVENGAMFQWDFGDGEEPDRGPEVNHYYHYFYDIKRNENPQFNITLNVTDRAGNYKSITRYVVVADKGVPTGVIQRVESVNIGTEVVWNASASFDNFYDPQNLNYEWDFGDNTTDQGMITKHTYTLPGTYEVVLNVSDPAGNFDLAYAEPVVVRGVNLAVTNIFFDKTRVNVGDKLKIQVNVTNTHYGTVSGADAQDMTISLYVGSKLIGTESLTTLLFNENAVKNFTWKATGGGKTHTLKANITLLNTSWELSWDDNVRERKIDVKEEESNIAGILTAILIIVVIVIFVLIFLRRRGIIGGGFGGKSKKKDKKDKKDKKKGKKK